MEHGSMQGIYCTQFLHFPTFQELPRLFSAKNTFYWDSHWLTPNFTGIQPSFISKVLNELEKQEVLK